MLEKSVLYFYNLFAFKHNFHDLFEFHWSRPEALFDICCSHQLLFILLIIIEVYEVEKHLMEFINIFLRYTNSYRVRCLILSAGSGLGKNDLWLNPRIQYLLAA